MESLTKAVLDFSNKCVLVVGDVILDEYISGPAESLSPEFPVPLIKVSNKNYQLGGAANVAANVAALGGKAYLCGVVGNDKYGNLLKELAANFGIELLMCDSANLPTIVKSRLMAGSHHLARFDIEEDFCLSKEMAEDLFKKIDSVLNSVDAIIFSDYNHGVFSNYLEFNSLLVERANELGIPVLVDPKPVNIDKFMNVGCVFPNLKEAIAISGAVTFSSKDNIEGSLFEISSRIRDRCNAKNVVITCSERGMYAYRASGDMVYRGKLLPVNADKIVDVCGAGDTAIAVAALSQGIDLYDMCELANIACGIVVSKEGTATVNQEEILKKLLEKV